MYFSAMQKIHSGILSILSESTVSITYRNPEFYQIRMSFQQNRRNTVNRGHKHIKALESLYGHS